MNSKTGCCNPRRLNTLATLLLLASSTTVSNQTVQRPGITSLIEARRGERSCWGVIIRLEQGRFNPKISSNQISVVDSKYGRDLSPAMEWTVSSDGRQLTVKFKQGNGDFGSGNAVSVSIAKSAFKELPPNSPNWSNSIEWSIDTDI